MAAMQFIVKFFPEISIKKRVVRRQFIKQLAKNLRRVLRQVDATVQVEREWDKLIITSKGRSEQLQQGLVDRLACIPGISWYLEVLEFPLGDFDQVAQHVLDVYGPRLEGRSFAVRCKRAGKHDFRSIDLERHIGGVLLANTAAAGVKLKAPEVEVLLEVRDQRLYVVQQRHPGMGGYPVGSLDPVLSLLSGGFDSTVASYFTNKRGMPTHFCFFNLGGRDHERGVKEVAWYLWQRYGSGHRVRFITVPFEEVVAELLQEVDDSQMGVVLKRLMLRAAEQLADQFEIDALVTGESVGQVSSQTLRNLAVIDAVTDKLVLRPLVHMDKGDIVHTAASIGTEEYAARMPEYCGVISVNPTTRARPERVVHAEKKFDMAVLERAVDAARIEMIDELQEPPGADVEVEELSIPLANGVVIDIRHPTEEELQPLQVQAEILKIPFYKLAEELSELDPGRTYMLYCDRGVMSRLHAGSLHDAGFHNIKVYRPATQG